MSTRLAKPRNRHWSVGVDQPDLKELARALTHFVKKLVPGARKSLNAWGIPTFLAPDPFCFYLAGKRHLTLGFHCGSSLEDPERLLEGTGKNLRHVKLRGVDDLELKGLADLVLEARQFKSKTPLRGMRGPARTRQVSARK